MIFDRLEKYKDEMIKLMSELIEIPAIPPEFGGKGELKKAEHLMKYLGDFDFLERFDAADDRAYGGLRPNIVAKIEGTLKKTVWVVAHLDVVPEGDTRLWRTPPFKAIINGDRIYGRGTEDKGQAIVSSLFAAKAILESGLTPKYSFGIAFVSDEECGSNFGIKHLLKQNVFKKDDLFIVSDYSSRKGEAIEIAEKSILWLKFTVYGDQLHASAPLGVNASRRAMKFILDLDEKLHNKFDAEDKIFNPPRSTFEPTKREKNVENINTIPGIDVSYMDCRILPIYSLEEVLEYIEDIRRFHEMRDGKPIEIEVVQKESSPKTLESSEIVQKLKKALKDIRGVDAKLVGIGGNTCAAVLRRAGYTNTVAWQTGDSTAHMPNEYCLIQNIFEDAKIFTTLPFEPGY
ncbi:MAG: M20 family metallo-hydrolase [Archaeoglobaceae archaeon]